MRFASFCSLISRRYSRPNGHRHCCNKRNAVRRNWRQTSNHHPLKTPKSRPNIFFLPWKLSTFENPTVGLINQAKATAANPNVWKFYKTWIYMNLPALPPKKLRVARFISHRYPSSPRRTALPDGPWCRCGCNPPGPAALWPETETQQDLLNERGAVNLCGNTCGWWRKVMG